MAQPLDDDNTIRVSKLDAARRQLRTAITLWFNGGDPVSIHTLACAAYEIVHTVSKVRDPNRPGLLFDSAPEETRKEFNDTFREAANFFKHADRDPHGLISFSFGLTEIFFWYAICGLDWCGESIIDEFTVYLNWVRLRNPQLLPEAARVELEERLDINRLVQLLTLPKDQFFEIGMRALRNGQF
jgi:hypothetical protein